MRRPTRLFGGTSAPASTAGRKILLLVGSAAVGFAVELIAFQLWTGDALRGIHVYSQNPGAYGGHLLAWPFHSLLTTPGMDGASTGRIVYIWIHVVVTLAACALVAYRLFPAGNSDRRDLLSLPLADR